MKLFNTFLKFLRYGETIFIVKALLKKVLRGLVLWEISNMATLHKHWYKYVPNEKILIILKQTMPRKHFLSSYCSVNSDACAYILSFAILKVECLFTILQ